MTRKRRHEEHANHERWLVSYADFITLLFAFFVVMYAMSSVNEGKYRVLSDSLVEAFSESPMRTIDPIQVGELARTPKVDLADSREVRAVTSEPPIMLLEGPGLEPISVPVEDTVNEEPAPQKDQNAVNEQEEHKDVDTIAEELTTALKSLIEAELIEVRKKNNWVEVEMKSHVLFESGSARLSAEAFPLLERLAQALSRFGNPIRAEGFTDNQPISTVVYPSNWELSAARAASVVHLFTTLSIFPERMAAIGYAEQWPIADNSTPEGRQKNRRVVIVVSGEDDRRQIQKTDPVDDEQQSPGHQAVLQEGPPASDKNPGTAAQSVALPDDVGAGNASQ